MYFLNCDSVFLLMQKICFNKFCFLLRLKLVLLLNFIGKKIETRYNIYKKFKRFTDVKNRTSLPFKKLFKNE